MLVAAGLGVLVTTIPQMALAMKIAGSVYLLYLAWQVAGAGALERTTARDPSACSRRSPSSWSTRRSGSSRWVPCPRSGPPNVPIVLGSALVALAMMAIAIPSSVLWVVGGDALNRLIERPAARRAVSLGLALLVVATVVLVWIEPDGSSGRRALVRELVLDEELPEGSGLASTSGSARFFSSMALALSGTPL